MEAPHHDVRHRYGSVLCWIPCFRTLGKQHSLPGRHAANDHRLKWPASSSAEIAFTSESFLPSGPVIGCINSQCISPIMGRDRESGTEGVSKRSRQKGSWTDIGREAGGSRQFPAMTLRTACTILVVTPLHSGILRPPLSASPFRLLYRSLGMLAPPCLSGSGKPGLIVRIYSLSYPRILSNLH